MKQEFKRAIANLDAHKEKSKEEKLAHIFEGKLTTIIRFNDKEG